MMAAGIVTHNRALKGNFVVHTDPDMVLNKYKVNVIEHHTILYVATTSKIKQMMIVICLRTVLAHIASGSYHRPADDAYGFTHNISATITSVHDEMDTTGAVFVSIGMVVVIGAVLGFVEGPAVVVAANVVVDIVVEVASVLVVVVVTNGAEEP